jgi:septum site-determining protein MinC
MLRSAIGIWWSFNILEETSQPRINIKGTSDGLVIHMGAGDWNGLLTDLATRLEQTTSFFKGGRVALHVGPRQLTQHQLERVGNLLQGHQMSLWAVISESDETRRVAASDSPRSGSASPTEASQAESDAILIRRTLRSGQTLCHTGHVVVIGDVNPGAEIIAGGDVVVWGRLRGIVHAGAGSDDDNAVVCALVLAPMQLRIGQHIARSPGSESEQGVVPEVASVQDGQIVAESWGGYGKGNE